MKTLARMMLTGAALALAAPAAAVTTMNHVFDAPEFNGDGRDGRVTVANWVFALTPGERIVGAFFASRFGNSVADSSSIGAVDLNGIVVGACDGPGDACWDGPGAAFLYSFSAAQFSALIGDLRLSYDQTGCCAIRLGASRLTIVTDRETGGLPPPPPPPPPVAVVPEPAAWAMMIAGFALVGGAARFRRRAASPAARAANR